MRYHFSPIRLSKVKNFSNSTAGASVENTGIYLHVGVKTGATFLGHNLIIAVRMIHHIL